MRELAELRDLAERIDDVVRQVHSFLRERGMVEIAAPQVLPRERVPVRVPTLRHPLGQRHPPRRDTTNV